MKDCINVYVGNVPWDAGKRPMSGVFTSADRSHRIHDTQECREGRFMP